MNAAVRAEARKLLRAPVGIIATLAIVGGTLALLGGITAALRAGNPELTAKAGAAASLDWSGLLSGAAQITSAGGLLGFGVVLSWIVAREFTDGTVTGLFALPVGRGRIALAKLLVYAAWACAVSLLLTLGILALGLALGYGAPTGEAREGLARQALLSLLGAALAVPVAWVATVTRSLLAAVGSAIALVVLAQVGVLAGAGGWMPPAAPALWAMTGGDGASAPQLLVSLAVGVVSAVLVCVAWERLQLAR